jgi:rubrerythrin
MSWYSSYPYDSRPAAQTPASGFKDFPDFLKKLQKAVNDEASAIRFYERLEAEAPNEKQKNLIRHALEDEKKHLHMFVGLYRSLTGRQPEIRPEETVFSSYKEGIEIAFGQELEAFEMYRDMYLSVTITAIRDILLEAFTDEQEHAMRFAFIHAEL